MPTIKRKVEMNLGELLCWAIENKEQARFRDISSKSMRVRFNDNAKPEIIFAKRFLPIEQTFKVEIVEPITEDTVLPEFVTRTVKGHYGLWKKGSINSFKHITFNDVEAFYIPNDDLTMTLIWTKEKGLVE